jgi:putative PIN family toxin of toxin-antitoxin system
MKVFFDTNVYVAEALLGEAAEAMLAATEAATWRIYISETVLDEIERVLVDYLEFSQRLSRLTRQRCMRRAIYVRERPSRHEVPDDPADSAILRAAVDAGADYLVTNDDHLLRLNPYESLRIVSMTEYYEILRNEGRIP